jgi:hypothetical protein
MLVGVASQGRSAVISALTKAVVAIEVSLSPVSGRRRLGVAGKDRRRLGRIAAIAGDGDHRGGESGVVPLAVIEDVVDFVIGQLGIGQSGGGAGVPGDAPFNAEGVSH